MNDFMDMLKALDDFDLDDEPQGDSEIGYWERFHAEHGALVEVRQEAYHDVRVYADGYEERDYIGD